MPIQIQGNGGVTNEVDDSSTRALRAVLKPYAYSTLGHYRMTTNILSVAAQAAAARIFEIRNNAANFLVITRAQMRAGQEAAGTAQQNALQAFKATAFTVLDTTSTATPVSEVMRTTEMAVAPGGAQLRQSTAAAGMTGGTITVGTGIIAELNYSVAAAATTTASTIWTAGGYLFNPETGEHPLILKQNEGLVLVNKTLNVTSYGIRWFFDLSWAEVTAF